MVTVKQFERNVREFEDRLGQPAGWYEIASYKPDERRLYSVERNGRRIFNRFSEPIKIINARVEGALLAFDEQERILTEP